MSGREAPTAEQVRAWAAAAGLGYRRVENGVPNPTNTAASRQHFAALAHAAGYRAGLEAAAKIAEGHFIHGHSVAGPGFAKVCADRIRAAKGA